MLLLVVDDCKAFEKKEKYIENLFIDGILHANNIKEAEALVKEKNTVDLLVINNIVVETNYEIQELKKLNDSFPGSIILKVTDESLGIRLIKRGAITDYFLADENEDVELSNLKKALKTSSIKTRINKNICQVNECMDFINKITTKR